MNFIPLSNEELEKQRQKLSPGDANFEITDALEKTSSKGNPMVELHMKVWDSEGTEGNIRDYITDGMQWKIKNLLESIDRVDWYSAGKLPAQSLIGLAGRCHLYLQKNGEHAGKISVKDYLPSTPGMNIAKKVLGGSIEPKKDDIPF